MTPLSRIEIRKRALRAASQVALLGAFACGPVPAETSPSAERPPSGAAVIQNGESEEDAGVTPDAASEPIDGLADAGVRCSRSNWDEYLKCCDEYGWSSSHGCSAWGPAVPPSFEEVA